MVSVATVYLFTANPAETVYLRFGNLNGVSSAGAAGRAGAYDSGIIRTPTPTKMQMTLAMKRRGMTPISI